MDVEIDQVKCYTCIQGGVATYTKKLSVPSTKPIKQVIHAQKGVAMWDPSE